jgi:hypothetical protein
LVPAEVGQHLPAATALKEASYVVANLNHLAPNFPLADLVTRKSDQTILVQVHGTAATEPCKFRTRPAGDPLEMLDARLTTMLGDRAELTFSPADLLAIGAEWCQLWTKLITARVKASGRSR